MDTDLLYNNTFSKLSNEDEHYNVSEHSALTPTIRFWVLLVSFIPSIICSLIILWLLLSNRGHRRSLNHRIIIIQLIGGLIFLLTNIPIYLNYLRLGYVWPQTPAMCYLGWFVGDRYADTMTILMAWASFQRHILVFHDRGIPTAKKRIFVHYLPVTLIILYYLLYYVIVIGFPPCQNIYDYTKNWCSSPCWYQNEILSIYETIFNDILATILVPIFSISLIIRVLWQKRIHLHRPLQWRKHRKIILILLSISTIYLVFNIPIMIIDVLHLCGLSKKATKHLEPYFEFLNYFIFILYPFICLSIMFTKFWNRRERRLVGPIALNVVQRPKIQIPLVEK